MNLQKVSTSLSMLNRRLISVAVVLAIPLAAQSQEMCRYPVEKEAYEFTIVDITGYDNPDIRSMLAGKTPTINCETSPGKSPTCATPWGGKVYMNQCGADTICIQGIQDREGRLIDFRNLYGTGQLQFAYFDRRNGYGVYACGQLEGLGVRAGEWFVLEPQLVGDRFDKLTYKIGSETRAFNAKKQWRIIYGAPSSATAGNQGSF
jgi:hypothetical protein